MNTMIPIKLPGNSIKYIVFQRTEYLKGNFVFKLLTLLGSYTHYYKLSVTLKSLLFSTQIKNEFSKDMNDEFSTIKKYLPQSASSVLDIGCGVAGIDVLISHHYQNKIGVFLIDKTLVDDNVYYGFEKRGSFYNLLHVSKKNLEINGVDSNNIHLQEATTQNEIKFKQSFDVVVSLISCGFHYPISTYLDEIYNKLNKNGILIVDIRENTSGEKEIEKKFGNYDIILDGRKFIRVLAKKQ